MRRRPAHRQSRRRRFELFTGTGGEAFAEQLIASGVKYVFGNSASEDAHFYEALVNRPQLQYILTPHEGPGAAMAAGYVKASGQPAIVMEAAVVGLTNALGQMFNAWKEQTPLVFYSYRSEESLAAGRDGFEELPGQEQLTDADDEAHVDGARGPSRFPRRSAARSAWRGRRRTGPTYINWHSDFTPGAVHGGDHPARSGGPADARPAEPGGGAARREAAGRRPASAAHRRRRGLQGEGVRQGRAARGAAGAAGDAGAPGARELSAAASALGWAAFRAGASSRWRIRPKLDLVINIGNKLQHNSPAPIVSRRTPFIDMRNDAASIGNVMTTAAPLVADVAYGTEDLLAAVNDLLTPALKARIAERADEVRAFSARARQLRALVSKNPLWDASPLEADRVT